MTDKVRQMAPVIWEEIQKAKKVLLCCHTGPDGDSYGSVLAMTQVLKDLGKKVTNISGDDKKLQPFSDLPGFDEMLEKNYFEINASDFDLFLILDSASLHQISKMGEVKFPPSLRTVVIDQHPTNPGFGDVNLVDTSYPAVCQILYDLLNEWGLAISPKAALCLYIGMYTDTGGFKYAGTTAETLFAAAALAKINPDFPRAIFTMENSAKPEDLKYFSLALSSIEVYFSGQVAISSICFQDLQKNGLVRENVQSAELANFLKSVKGWNIGIALSEKTLNQVSVSLRTRNPEKFDVSKLGESLGGGGLTAAAGAMIKKPFQEAKQILLDSISKVYPELKTP